jgi:hypothetical protein
MRSGGQSGNEISKIISGDQSGTTSLKKRGSRASIFSFVDRVWLVVNAAPYLNIGEQRPLARLAVTIV